MSGEERDVVGSLRDGTFPVILAGPSGAGKTTIRDRLLEEGDDFVFSVSMTTRSRRSGEREGVDYRFVDRATFAREVEAGRMLEHAAVHGELYGTPRANLEAAAVRRAHLLLDIDVQGARQVREAVPGTVLIFILPPDAERILSRLRARGSETDEQLRRRLETAGAELKALAEFDYAVLNDDLEAAVRAVRDVVSAESRSLARASPGVERFAHELAREIRRAMP